MTSHYDAESHILFSSIFSEIPYHRHMLPTVIIDVCFIQLSHTYAKSRLTLVQNIGCYDNHVAQKCYVILIKNKFVFLIYLFRDVGTH